jgi:hypothetical protein
MREPESRPSPIPTFRPDIPGAYEKMIRCRRDGILTERREYNEAEVGTTCALRSLKVGTGNRSQPALSAVIDLFTF